MFCEPRQIKYRSGAIGLTNTPLLKAKMVLNGDTISTLGEALGINRQNASIKINGKRDFKQREMLLIALRYKLTYEEFAEIFFGKEAVIDERERLRLIAG